MSRTLLHFVHPALEKSRVNAHLLKRALTLEDVEVNDLYQLYPDFQVDFEREQKLMEEHDRIVFQFPLYWYSSPALLKEWFDIVLQYGWAYGRDGKALVDKKARFVVTTGGPEDSYTSVGHNGFTMDEFLRPMTSSLELCGMKIEESFFIHDALHLEGDKLERVIADYETWMLED